LPSIRRGKRVKKYVDFGKRPSGWKCGRDIGPPWGESSSQPPKARTVTRLASSRLPRQDGPRTTTSSSFCNRPITSASVSGSPHHSTAPSGPPIRSARKGVGVAGTGGGAARAIRDTQREKRAGHKGQSTIPSPVLQDQRAAVCSPLPRRSASRPDQAFACPIRSPITWLTPSWSKTTGTPPRPR